MSKALIIVDIQKFYLHDAPDELPGNIVRHIDTESYDAVAFTVFKNQPDSNFEKSLHWSKCASEEDIELPPEFAPYNTGDNVFSRATYSGFSATGLQDYLSSKNIEQVTICGVDTDACVLATAFSAFDNGYLVSVNFDLTFSSGELEPEARRIMERSLIARSLSE